MEHLKINGIEERDNRYVSHPEWQIADLMERLRSDLNSDINLISSVCVDGIEITDGNETEVLSLPLGQVGTVEVYTAHPRELAEETLQMLVGFSLELASYSETLAGGKSDPEFERKFLRLIDGLDTFADGISTSRAALRLADAPLVQHLEEDLIQILRDIFEAKRNRNFERLDFLFKKDLPDNLRHWNATGIPTIIRSRDC